MQVDRHQRRAGNAAPWLQVLWADTTRGLLQGGARAEPGTGGALRHEPPGADPAATLLAAFGAVARCYPKSERHPCRHPGAEEPTHWTDSGRGAPAIHAGPRSA